ncbi:MAG TPA: hypothetical protein VKA15_14870 [Isosphaeraceae bacterium]|nr:hypothetical protein [Isosphaeraceae bacterium]
MSKLLLLAWAMSLSIALAGCGASNPNEREFLNTAPPGEQAKDEQVSDRRARTHTLSKQEVRNQAAAEKAAAAKKP